LISGVATDTSRTMHRLPTILAATLLLGACQMFGTASTPAPEPQVLAAPPRKLSAEEAIGARENPRVVAEYGGVYSDAETEAMIGDVVAKLVAASDEPSRSYKITVLNSPTANAFALPGNYLYVTRGLVALANDRSELAAVLSHEMAHVLANHALSRARAAERVSLVEQVASDVLSNSTQGKSALAQSKMTLAQFSREQEVEADRLGIQIAGRAGFDPYAAPRFIAALERYAAFRSALGAKDGAPNFLASHPAALERRELATRVAAQVGSTHGASTDRDAYLSALDGLVYGDDPSEGFVRGREFLHPRLAIRFAAPEGYRLENTKEAVLAAADRDTAMRFDGVSVAAEVTPAAYLASGWVNGLDPTSIRETRVNGLAAATASAKAGAWRFRIGAVKVGTGMYRLIFADRVDDGRIERDLEETLASFRRLDGAERARLRPLRLDIVKVAPGDTAASLSEWMQGTERKAELFRLLNGLAEGEEPQPGRLVKIVVD